MPVFSSLIPSLPIDLLYEIVKHLNPAIKGDRAALLCCRAVSSAFYEVAHSKAFSHVTLTAHLDESPYPFHSYMEFCMNPDNERCFRAITHLTIEGIENSISGLHITQSTAHVPINLCQIRNLTILLTNLQVVTLRHLEFERCRHPQSLSAIAHRPPQRPPIPFQLILYYCDFPDDEGPSCDEVISLFPSASHLQLVYVTCIHNTYPLLPESFTLDTFVLRPFYRPPSSIYTKDWDVQGLRTLRLSNLHAEDQHAVLARNIIQHNTNTLQDVLLEVVVGTDFDGMFSHSTNMNVLLILYQLTRLCGEMSTWRSAPIYTHFPFNSSFSSTDSEMKGCGIISSFYNSPNNSLLQFNTSTSSFTALLDDSLPFSLSWMVGTGLTGGHAALLQQTFRKSDSYQLGNSSQGCGQQMGKTVGSDHGLKLLY